MPRYIELNTLVTEIERLKKSLPWGSCASQISMECNCKNEAYNDVISLVNSMEVKEVDLEKEIDKFYGMYRKDGQTFSLEDNEECVDWKVDCNPEFEKYFANHFFELGLNTHK